LKKMIGGLSVCIFLVEKGSSQVTLFTQAGSLRSIML